MMKRDKTVAGLNPLGPTGSGKTRVPPREERLEQIGDPKTPKMGGITPTKLELPEVDDLLDKMKKETQKINSDAVLEAANQIRESYFQRESFFQRDLWNDSSSSPKAVPCMINCSCEPCRRGACSSCAYPRLF